MRSVGRYSLNEVFLFSNHSKNSGVVTPLVLFRADAILWRFSCGNKIPHTANQYIGQVCRIYNAKIMQLKMCGGRV